MQNVQNAAEIQQRVINLVDLYRTKVGKESKIAQEAKQWSEDEFRDDYLDGQDYEDWVKHLKINDQLLGHFYSVVAGKDAKKDVLEHFLPDYYDSTVFTEEEEYFLRSHFKEMVNYIIQTPSDDLAYVAMYDSKDWHLIPNEVLNLIGERVTIPEGATIYNPFACFAEFSQIYKGRKFLFEVWGGEDKERTWPWKWMELALYANEVNAEIIEDGNVPQSYDAIVTYIRHLPVLYRYEKTIDNHDLKVEDRYDPAVLPKIHKMYENLEKGGKMIMITREDFFFDNERMEAQELHLNRYGAPLKHFAEFLVANKAFVEIIQLPPVLGDLFGNGNSFIILVAEKGVCHEFTTMVDARFASHDSNKKNNRAILDMDAFHSMINNHGMEYTTGLRKMVQVPSSELKADLLLPQFYVVEKPTVEEHPVPLSELCSIVEKRIYEIDSDLPEDTPWIKKSDLSSNHKGELDINSLQKANCPNNPKEWKYGTTEINKFMPSAVYDYDMDKPSWDDYRISQYRNCTYLDGNKDAVLLDLSQKEVTFALLRATGKPVAVNKGILVVIPKAGFDALSLLALFRLPIVYRQLLTYHEYGIGCHLDDVLVPTDKRIISDELSRMKREKSVTKEFRDKAQAMKTEYINEVRMRKHDMGQKVFDLINTEDLMRYYVENRETESDLWPQMEEQLNHFRKTINELSDMLDQLSQEERFGTPELLDLNGYFAGLQHSSIINGFKLSYLLDRDSILNLQLSHMGDKELKDISAIKVKPTVFIAKTDLQRVVSNILTNAQKHGFVDPGRKDYEVIIRLEFNAEKGMYQIDFRNNGKALPEGLNKMRYGIKGEKAGQTAGTGLGGSIVKSIVEHYKGDYDVLMDEEWTVIRVYLPIAI